MIKIALAPLGKRLDVSSVFLKWPIWVYEELNIRYDICGSKVGSVKSGCTSSRNQKWNAQILLAVSYMCPRKWSKTRKYWRIGDGLPVPSPTVQHTLHPVESLPEKSHSHLNNLTNSGPRQPIKKKFAGETLQKMGRRCCSIKGILQMGWISRLTLFLIFSVTDI